MHKLKLQSGSKIAIIGGGPAGVFFAHFILKHLSEHSIDVSITIFDGKDFLMAGPKGCNLCAGVLSDSLYERLEEEGIVPPDSRIISRVEGYVLHVHGEQIKFSCQDNQIKPIATVFRGNGPRCSTFPDIVSFDDYLLSWIRERGVRVISQPVGDIELPKDRMKSLRLSYGENEKDKTFEADLVVGAFGINSSLLKKIQAKGFGYRPPSTLGIYQAEVMLGKDDIERNFGNNIHVFVPKSKTIRYASVVPKGDYISLTVIGRKDADKDILSALTDLGEIDDKILFDKPACYCFPRIAVSPAKKPFTDRLVILGDASFSRHYKNGIESALVTAQLAARTVVERGIDSASFSSSYFKDAKRQIISDNHYGRFLLKANDIITSSPLLTRAQISLINDTEKEETSKNLRFILWNMFTGNVSYKEIFWASLDLRMQKYLFWNVIKSIFGKNQKSNQKK